MRVVVKDCAYVLVHVPGLVRYGSKPYRDIEDNGGPGGALEQEIDGNLRSFADAVAYPPNQVYIGNLTPDQLQTMNKPWFDNPAGAATREGKFGEILPEDEFYGWLKAADDFDLLWLSPEFIGRVAAPAAAHPLAPADMRRKMGAGVPIAAIREKIAAEAALPLYHHQRLIGSIRRDHDKDDSLKAHVLAENLMTKASAALAMKHLFKRAAIEPRQVDFILSCSEEAVGDRYNRGGGSLSKAIGEMCACQHASGHDIKAFCAAPIHAIMNAAALVSAGVFKNVAVVGGGCLSKIGMKYAGHLKSRMPILEDVLAGFAFLLTCDDGSSPIVRLDSIGKHDIGASSNQQAIMTSLIAAPLDRLGLRITDIDKFATEMHNPEITLPAGSGNTPLTNYKIMAALAVLRKEIRKEQMEDFVQKRGMPGFAPTQGHVPAAVPFLGHAMEAMRAQQLERVMFVAKGSLFLGRMSQLSDGLSFLLEKNPGDFA